MFIYHKLCKQFHTKTYQLFHITYIKQNFLVQNSETTAVPYYVLDKNNAECYTYKITEYHLSFFIFLLKLN
jgi:hypothetical protein